MAQFQIEKIPNELKSGVHNGTFVLKASYPNPFNPETIIPFELPESSEVRLEIYDLLGRRLAILTDQVYETGRHEVLWNAANAASGVYIIRMLITNAQGQHRQFNRQVTLLK